MSTDFSLRVAGHEDVAGIRGLIDASVRHLQAGDYTAAQIEGALATVFTVDTRLIEDGTYFVAETELGELAGCGGWSFRGTLYGGDLHLGHMPHGEGGRQLDPAVDAARIRAIFVHPRFSRLGLGGRLLETAERAAAAAGFRRLEMGSTLTGVALYRLRGYRETARVSVAVGAGERIEVVLMGKELAG